MQEIIVYIIATIALVYLFVKFAISKKSHNCDDCGINDSSELKKH